MGAGHGTAEKMAFGSSMRGDRGKVGKVENDGGRKHVENAHKDHDISSSLVQLLYQARPNFLRSMLHSWRSSSTSQSYNIFLSAADLGLRDVVNHLLLAGSSSGGGGRSSGPVETTGSEKHSKGSTHLLQSFGGANYTTTSTSASGKKTLIPLYGSKIFRSIIRDAI